MSTSRARVFLLSPANTGGKRGSMVFNDRAQFEVAAALRQGGAPLGDVYQFISGLYFRGKLAYARAFANAPDGVPGAVVITAGFGLIPPETVVTIEQLRAIAAVPVDAGELRYREPLERDAAALAETAGDRCDFVLLGSVASDKYVEPLLKVFGSRLLFPCDFVGRGDMSRGGLMLRAARAGVELAYMPVLGAAVRGKRPPRLERIR